MAYEFAYYRGFLKKINNLLKNIHCVRRIFEPVEPITPKVADLGHFEHLCFLEIPFKNAHTSYKNGCSSF